MTSLGARLERGGPPDYQKFVKLKVDKSVESSRILGIWLNLSDNLVWEGFHRAQSTKRCAHPWAAAKKPVELVLVASAPWRRLTRLHLPCGKSQVPNILKNSALAQIALFFENRCVENGFSPIFFFGLWADRLSKLEWRLAASVWRMQAPPRQEDIASRHQSTCQIAAKSQQPELHQEMGSYPMTSKPLVVSGGFSMWLYSIPRNDKLPIAHQVDPTLDKQSRG